MVSLADLAALDLGPAVAAAAAGGRLGVAVELAGQDLARVVTPKWTGGAADAAARRLAALAQSYVDTYPPLGTLDRLVAEYAAVMAQYQRQLFAVQARSSAGPAEVIALLDRATRTDLVAAQRISALSPPAGGPPEAGPPATSALRPDGDPATVRAWWGGLSPAERARLVQAGAIGGLDGVPAKDRDAANRLARALAGGADVAPGRSGRAYLLRADDRRAIVALGDPDAAENIVILVPGVGSRPDRLGTELARADRLAADAAATDPGRRTVAIAWLGYDAPQSLVEAVSPGPARAGAPDLAAFVAGLRASHRGPAPHVTVVGYSYGSTLVGYAASAHALAADELVLLGSPGVAAPSAARLGGNVWASYTGHDPVRAVSFVHGGDPGRAGFGAHVFDSDTGGSVRTAHAAYWDDGGSTRRNLAFITTGRYGSCGDPG